MDIQSHIENNLPNYHSCNKVLRSDILQRFVDGELEHPEDINAVKSEIESVKHLFSDKQIAEILRKANDLELLEECP